MADEGKREVEEVTQRTLSSGGILAKLYFDMESDKKEDLQPLMVDLVNNRLLKSPGVVYCVGAIDEPVKLKDTYTTSAQLTVLFSGLWPLISVMFSFSPAGIEIIKPTKDYAIKPTELQAILLNIAQTSLDYSNYILSRVLGPEEFEKISKQMKNREELGKKMIEKGNPEDKK